MSKHPKDRAERLEVKKKAEAEKLPRRKDKRKQVNIKSFQELVEHINANQDPLIDPEMDDYQGS